MKLGVGPMQNRTSSASTLENGQLDSTHEEITSSGLQTTIAVGDSSGHPEMKALLTGLHNRTWTPRSGCYSGPDLGQNDSKNVGLVGGI